MSTLALDFAQSRLLAKHDVRQRGANPHVFSTVGMLHRVPVPELNKPELAVARSGLHSTEHLSAYVNSPSSWLHPCCLYSLFRQRRHLEDLFAGRRMDHSSGWALSDEAR